MQRLILPLTVGLSLALTLAGSSQAAAQDGKGLLEARQGHTTKLIRQDRDEEPLGEPPAELFERIKYPTKIGEMAAYLSKLPEGAPAKVPAMIWITGGFPPGGIGEAAWTPADPDNDQSAKDYRVAGMLMMYPTLRGSFANPGTQECLYGEVDDVLAAIEYVRGLKQVDPERVYLGGHSTGGTLVLLVAAAAPKVRAVISFGPVGDLRTYGDESLPFDPAQDAEWQLRAPIRFLDAIKVPTFVIEGSTGGNADSLRELQAATKNPNLAWFVIDGATHFDVLAPLNAHLAAKLSKGSLELKAAELQSAFSEAQRAQREANDLRTLAEVRERGPIEREAVVRFHIYAYEVTPLEGAAKAAKAAGLTALPVEQRADDEGDTYYLLTLTRKVRLNELQAVFASSKAAADLAASQGATYLGWEPEN